MIIITGTYPPELCGVADYTYNLLKTPTAVNNNWHLIYTKDARISNFRSTVRLIKSFNDNCINIQYPSRGYAKSILPHLICLYFRIFTKVKISVTIHEYTQLGWKGHLLAYILLIFAHKLIFTNDYEMSAAIKKCSIAKCKSSVIKIYSNIPSSTVQKKISSRVYDVGYFGFIRPQKGLENYISTIKEVLKERPNLKAYIMGNTLPDLKDYAEKIIGKAQRCGITFFEGKSETEVADILSDTKISLLPFPDGLSERRGSFMASAKNHAIIISTNGKFVTLEQRELLIIDNPDQMVSHVSDVLNGSTEKQDVMQKNVQLYVERNLPASWDDVAQSYYKLLL